MWKHAVDHAIAIFLGLILAMVMFVVANKNHWPLPGLLVVLTYLWGHIVVYYICADFPEPMDDDDEEDWEGA